MATKRAKRKPAKKVVPQVITPVETPKEHVLETYAEIDNQRYKAPEAKEGSITFKADEPTTDITINPVDPEPSKTTSFLSYYLIFIGFPISFIAGMAFSKMLGL